MAVGALGRYALIGGLSFGAVLALVMGAAFLAIVGGSASLQNTQGAFEPSQGAIADIPAAILPIYMQAAQSRDLDWAVLAAVGKIETDHGRNLAVSTAGAEGWMQFMPATWAGYGVDGNHDGRKDPNDPEDAIPAAADLLKANGAPKNYNRALFAYNHANWYVAKVLAQAEKYRGAMTAASSTAAPMLQVSTATARDVLRLASGARPRIALTAMGRSDLSTGQIDPRISSLLVMVARQHTITVTSLKSGHSIYTTSGYVSNHASGRAVDVGTVDGERCNSHAHGRSGRCWQLAQQLARTSGPLHPSELIYGLDPDGPGPAVACLVSSCGGNHADHIHAGYD